MRRIAPPAPWPAWHGHQGSSEAARESLANLDRWDQPLRKFRDLKGGLANAGALGDRARARTAKLGRELAKAENPTKKRRQEF